MSDTDDREHAPKIHIMITSEVPTDGTPLNGASLDSVLEHLEGQVQEHGWALVGGSVNLGNEDDGSFTYTVGLHKRGLPEIITAGLCRCADDAVCALARRQLKAGAYEDGQITQLDGEPVRLARWHYTRHLMLLNAYYAHYSQAPTLLMVREI